MNTTDAPLPPGWITLFDEQCGKYYFVNTADGYTTWDDPRVAPSPAGFSAMPSAQPNPAGGFQQMPMPDSQMQYHQPQSMPGAAAVGAPAGGDDDQSRGLISNVAGQVISGYMKPQHGGGQHYPPPKHGWQGMAQAAIPAIVGGLVGKHSKPPKPQNHHNANFGFASHGFNSSYGFNRSMDDQQQ